MTTKTTAKTTAPHKPTCNGVIKGRPGKGKVLSLGERKRCYDGHSMSDENTFTYKGRQWCRKCRKASRLRSRLKRLAEARALAVAKAKTDRAALKTATAKANARKARKPRAAKKVA